MSELPETKADGFWAIVEIMGHKRYAGHVAEQVIGGASFVRVDVPKNGERAAFSKLFGAASIYCITPVSEEAARVAAGRLNEQPLSEWDLPQEWRQAISQGRLQYEPEDPNDYPDDDPEF